MNLAKKFEEAASCVTKISSLDKEKMYPIVPAKGRPLNMGRPSYRPSDSESRVVQIFTPKRHCSVISDMDKINTGAVSLNILHKGISETSKSYLLAIVN